jgi:S-DNA-T family DNA segregation ATPase FtsK/SpoIIIE
MVELPHLLLSDETGSGKSVALNSIIASLLMLNHPSDLSMLMIDVKRVELTLYNGILHLRKPVITDASKAIQALSDMVEEMEKRRASFTRRKP